jgi:hypothetical protein
MWWTKPFLIVGLVVNAAALQGQSGNSGVGELSGSTGVTFGSVGTHLAVGASSGWLFSRYGAWLMDLSYMPLGGSTLQSYGGQVSVAGSALYDWSFTGQIRIPIRDKWEPYLIGGPAVLFSSYRVAARNGQEAGVYGNRGDTDLAFETGTGVRYFLADNWGIRAETKFTFSHRSFGRFSIGGFYQFEGELGFHLLRRRRSQRSDNLRSW